MLIRVLILLAMAIICTILRVKCTRMVIYPFAVAITVLLLISQHKSGGMLQIFGMWAISIVVWALMLFIHAKMQYNFRGHVLSWSLLFNRLTAQDKIYKSDKAARIVGRVMPYSTHQLQWNGKSIVLGEVASAGGLLIQGATGSGKTYGMLSMMRQNMEAGNSVIFAEFKGDPDVVDKLSNYALARGYEVYCVANGHGDFNYDPLKSLNHSGRVEAILNMRKWSLDGADAHYRTGVQLLLQRTLSEWSKQWTANGSAGSFTVGYMKWLKVYSPTRDEWDAYQTVLKLLELLITGSLQSVFCYQNGREMDFHELKHKKFLLLASFPSANREQATSFCSLMFRNLLDEMTSEPPKSNIFLYVDEFGSLDNPFIIKDLLEKGRSAKIATALSLQDINQIIIQTNEAYLNSILGTVNTFIVYSGATRVTAEKLAGVQIAEIEQVLMNLRKPINGHKPTAIYISKYPSVNRKTNSEVYRFEPFILNDDAGSKSKNYQPVEQPVENVAMKKDLERLLAGELTEDEQKQQMMKEQPLEVPINVEAAKMDKTEEKPVGGFDRDSISDLDSIIFGDK